MKATLTEQAPDSNAVAFLTDDTAARMHAASTADKGAAAAGSATRQQRTAAEADAAMAALLVGALTTAQHCNSKPSL